MDKQHAVINYEPNTDEHKVKDLGSLNGVSVLLISFFSCFKLLKNTEPWSETLYYNQNCIRCPLSEKICFACCSFTWMINLRFFFFLWLSKNVYLFHNFFQCGFCSSLSCLIMFNKVFYILPILQEKDKQSDKLSIDNAVITQSDRLLPELKITKLVFNPIRKYLFREQGFCQCLFSALEVDLNPVVLNHILHLFADVCQWCQDTGADLRHTENWWQIKVWIWYPLSMVL